MFLDCRLHLRSAVRPIDQAIDFRPVLCKFTIHFLPGIVLLGVLENLIVKIQNKFERPISLGKSIREKVKHAPDETKRVRVKIEGTDEEKENKAF